MHRSSYCVIKICSQEKKLFLIDMNIGKSVTNDAENIFAEDPVCKLYDQGYRIIYRDSMAEWGEMKMSNGAIQFLPYMENIPDIPALVR